MTKLWHRLVDAFRHEPWKPGPLETHVEKRMQQIAARVGHDLDEPPSERTVRLFNIKRSNAG